MTDIDPTVCQCPLEAGICPHVGEPPCPFLSASDDAARLTDELGPLRDPTTERHE